MRGTLHAGIAAIAMVGVSSTALASGSASTVARSSTPGTCAHAADPGTQVSVAQLRKAIACLINEERIRRGKSPLSKDGRLQKTAQNHTNAMVRTDCLGHRCPGEAGVEDRIRATGYFRLRDFRYAEDVGCARTAESIVALWMDSALHRRNILDDRLRDLGVGASHGRVPSRCGRAFSTFTAVFGFRGR